MRLPVLSFALLIAIAFTSNSHAQNRSRDMQKEAVIWEQLRALKPDLVDVFKKGTEQMDARDYKTATGSYQKIVDAAPNFDVGYRRLGTCLWAAGDHEAGTKMLQKAVELNRSPANLATFAQFIAFPTPGKTAEKADLQRALVLIQEANKKNSKPDADDLFFTARIALLTDDTSEFRRDAYQMMTAFPDLPESHYLNAIRASMDEKWNEAENEIHRAGELGLPSDVVKEFLDSGVHRNALEWKYASYALYVVIAWIAGLAALFVFGKTLSGVTLRSIDEFTKSSDVVTSTATGLRRIYRQLIQIAGWYYYISLPFVVVLLIAVAGGLVYAFLALGRIPLRLVLILAIVTLGTIYKLVQSLFLKVKPEDPGRPLTFEEAPALWALTKEVAGDIGTRPVDEIRMTIGTDVAVYERGTRKEKAEDKAKRILILGVGVLTGFRVQAFRAVLGHEYGHFTHRDTAGGDIALRVNNDMMNFAYAMAAAGHAVWWNLGFQFVRFTISCSAESATAHHDYRKCSRIEWQS